MADIKPTAAITSTVAAVAAAPIAAIEVSIESSPDKIQQLLRQLQVNATVTSAPANGVVELATSIGNFSVSLPQLADVEQLKLIQQLLSLFQNDRPFTLVIQPGSPPTQSLLLIPTDTSPTAATATSLSTNAPGTSVNLPASGISVPLTAVVLPASILSGLSTSESVSGQSVVLSPIPLNLEDNEAAAYVLGGGTASTRLVPAIPTPPGPPPVLNASGLVLANEVASEAVSSATPAVSSSNGLSAAPQTGTQSFGNLVTSEPQFASNLSSRLLGQTITLTLSNIPQAAANASDPGPNQLVATVVGKGPAGQLILQAGDLVLYVRQPVNASPGSTVLVNIDAAHPPQTLVPLEASDGVNAFSLQAVLAELAQIDPALAQHVLQTSVPQPTSQLPTTLLFFLSALKQGDTRGWLGAEASDALLRFGKTEVLSRLAQDLAPDGHLVRDAVVGDWRSYTVPLNVEGQLQSFYLYVHGDPNGSGRSMRGAPGAAQLRFLIDVRMTRLGPLQLDGLVQPKKLDMIVRSETALPSRLPQELRDTFLKTLEALGYTGGLSFQNGRDNWLTMKTKGTSREA